MWLCNKQFRSELPSGTWPNSPKLFGNFSTGIKTGILSRAEMLSEDSDGEDVHALAINNHYAKAFEYRKEREELSKCTLLPSVVIAKTLIICDSEREIRLGCRGR